MKTVTKLIELLTKEFVDPKAKANTTYAVSMDIKPIKNGFEITFPSGKRFTLVEKPRWNTLKKTPKPNKNFDEN